MSFVELVRTERIGSVVVVFTWWIFMPCVLFMNVRSRFVPIRFRHLLDHDYSRRWSMGRREGQVSDVVIRRLQIQIKPVD